MTNAGLIGNGIRLSAVLCLAFEDGILTSINREQILIYLAVHGLMIEQVSTNLAGFEAANYKSNTH